jgi:hypothetical protein
VYLSTSWFDGFGVLKTYRNRSDKTYKHLSLLVQFVRSECEYTGQIVIDPAGSVEPGQSAGVSSVARIRRGGIRQPRARLVG